MDNYKTHTMTPDQVIEKILLGGLLGLLGQGIRMAIGLKKLSDINAQKKNKEELNTGRLMVSLFIGFVAGALYVLLTGSDAAVEEQYVGNQFIFTVIAAGYAGSDFIEGLFNTYIAKMPRVNSGNSNTVVAFNPGTVAANTDTAVIVGTPANMVAEGHTEPADDIPETGANPS